MKMYQRVTLHLDLPTRSSVVPLHLRPHAVFSTRLRETASLKPKDVRVLTHWFKNICRDVWIPSRLPTTVYLHDLTCRGLARLVSRNVLFELYAGLNKELR